MPPRVKITKQDIIETSVEMVRQSGEGALNARSIASALGCSTQPIFSNFESIEELENEVYIAAYNRYLGFIEREVSSGAYPEYKAFGMAIMPSCLLHDAKTRRLCKPIFVNMEWNLLLILLEQ